MEAFDVGGSVLKVMGGLPSRGVRAQPLDKILRVGVVEAGVEYLLNLPFLVSFDFDRGVGGMTWPGTGSSDSGSSSET